MKLNQPIIVVFAIVMVLFTVFVNNFQGSDATLAPIYFLVSVVLLVLGLILLKKAMAGYGLRSIGNEARLVNPKEAIKSQKMYLWYTSIFSIMFGLFLLVVGIPGLSYCHSGLGVGMEHCHLVWEGTHIH